MPSLNTLITDAAYRDHAAFWTAVLDGVSDDFHVRQPWLSLPAGEAGVITTTRLIVPSATAERLRQIGGGQPLGLFAVLMSALAYLLHQSSGAAAVVVDTPPLGDATAEAIPLTLRVDATMTLREHLAQTGDAIAKSYTYQSFPIAQACDVLLKRPRPHTNVLSSFVGLHAGLPRLDPYDLRVTIADGAELSVALEGRAPAFSPEYLATWTRHFGHALEAFGDLAVPLNHIDVMDAAERRRLLVDYNAAGGTAAPDRTMHEWFQEQAHRSPDHEAVRVDDRSLTYDALNRLSNRLARFLQADYAINPGDVVGIVTHRSELAIVALLGVLKAGAVYLPIDPDYPEERLQFMVADAGVKALLVHSDHFPALASLYETPMFALDLQLSTLEAGDEDVASAVSPHDLAYIIYTSGSTGQPKAVLLEHAGFVNMVRHHIGAFGIGASDRLLQFYGHSFDSSLFEIFVSLLSGATLVMVDRDTINDPDRLSHHIDAHQVTTLTLPPIYQSALDRVRLSSVRRFVSAGDHCKVDDALAFARTGQYFNSYGPTETSVCVTHYQVDPQQRYGSRVPIGKPIAGTSIYLLDDRLAPVPEGIVGEICVGGVSLARGYLHRDDLTAEKFVPSPFAAGERLYRTGDLGAWLPDGNLELIGRKDDQVKIRGYRVELGEIESVLAQHPRVRESVVIASDDEIGHKRLIAYVSAGTTVDVADLKTMLRARLPEFMVPSMFVVLDAMPLTANGKIDRKALPAPDAINGAGDPGGGEPENATQASLAAIWREVLGRERVGIHDNLFELGGDSILVIQIVSRARSAGIKLVPNQLFEHQTIAALSQVATVAAPAAADEGPLEGAVPLGPMQAWFFERRFADPHHFNQSVLFEVPAGFDAAAADRATRALVDHHDALRLQFVQNASGRWSAEYGRVGGTTPFRIVDLSSCATSEQDARLRESALAAAAGFDLATGPLIRVVYFRLGGDRPGRLLFVVHHLAVDGVSWRLLLEDFRAACDQAARGGSIALPAKTTSYRTWVERLRAHASIVADERAYWLAPDRRDAAPIPIDRAFAPGANTVASAHEITRVLDAGTTSALLHEAPGAYNTEINDLLLTALAQTFAAWTGRDRLLVDVEGHGREDFVEDVDTSRTVGWFTSQFPVLLRVDPHATSGDAVKSVKEQLRAVPRRGAGFGVLRYLSDDADTAAAIGALPAASVLFNYLGQGGQAAGDEWTLVPGPPGLDTSPRAVRPHLVEINAIVLDGRLTLAWTFSEAVHAPATIDALASRYADALRALIDHCRTAATGQFTPSDFPAARMDQQSLDALIAKLSSS